MRWPSPTAMQDNEVT